MMLLNSSIFSGNEVEAIQLVHSKVTLDSSGRQIGELRNEEIGNLSCLDI